ncbi:hypothetical protein B0H12DRAFT_1103050 [Mycena haematopus]|nr:hypothetical protein B0H12DRAFT_1103050 [Mycena haematopus]
MLWDPGSTHYVYANSSAPVESELLDAAATFVPPTRVSATLPEKTEGARRLRGRCSRA